ncbi:TonB family protein [candidate division KSB1 bacterium]|nr:TonB family protein [candidate division KSB1 bacterium]
MNRTRSTIVFGIVLAVASAMAQNDAVPPKITVAIKELKMIKSTGIILSESEMTKIVFDELEKIRDFDVKYIANGNSSGDSDIADLIIDGEYELDGSLISLNYQINSNRTRMRIKQNVSQVELSEVKNEILKNITDLFSRVTFISTPPLANIEIDGIPRGTTPITFEHMLNGYHLVHVSKEDHFGTYQELDVSKSDTVHFMLAKQVKANEASPPTPKGGMPAIIKKVRYPQSFKEKNIEGEVTVLVIIDEKGKVKETRIAKSIGYPELDEAAVSAIKSVKWNPSKLNDQAIEGSTQVKIKFSIR